MTLISRSVVSLTACIALSLAAAWPATPALAASPPNMVVEAVQSPAWLERDGGQRQPLFPGMELRNNDQVKTGEGSRLLLRTRDGSSVKLGANATFKLGAIEQRPGNVFAASMNVLEGAFRFTTDALAKYRGRREINILVANVTAGVRGTDLWGKSVPNRQVVCLIEGRIEVAPPGEQAIVMDQPLQFYVRENDRSQPVASVLPAQIREWSAETEITPGRGAVRSGGRWQVTLVTVETQAQALDFYDRVRDAGYPAEIRPLQQDDKRAYTLRLANLPSREEALALAASLKGRMGLDEPRVSQ